MRGQPPAAAPCPPAGSGATSYRGVQFQSRGHLGRAPARCPITGPASCEAPAPAPPTPPAARMPGRCAAQRGAARCLGTQAMPSECLCPRGPSRPLPSLVPPGYVLENWRSVGLPANPLLGFTLGLLTAFLLCPLPHFFLEKVGGPERARTRLDPPLFWPLEMCVPPPRTSLWGWPMLCG